MKPFHANIHSIGATVARTVAKERGLPIDQEVSDQQISELMRYISNKAKSMHIVLMRVDQLLDCTICYLMYTREASFYGADFAEKHLLFQIERFGSRS